MAKGAETKPYVSSFASNSVKTVAEVKSATLGGRKSLDYLGAAKKSGVKLPSAENKSSTMNKIPVKGVETPNGSKTPFSNPLKLKKKELQDFSKLKSKLTGGLQGSKLPMKSIVPPFPSTEVGDSESKALSTSDDDSEQASTSSSIVSPKKLPSSPAPLKKGLPFMKKSSQTIDSKSNAESPNKFGVAKSSGNSSSPGGKFVSPPKLTFKEAADKKSLEGKAKLSPFGTKSFGIGQQKVPKVPSVKDTKQPKSSKSFGTQSGPTKLELPKMPMKTTFKKSVKGAESGSRLGTRGEGGTKSENFGSTPPKMKQVPASSVFPKKDAPVPKAFINEEITDESADDPDEQPVSVETIGEDDIQVGDRCYHL